MRLTALFLWQIFFIFLSNIAMATETKELNIINHFDSTLHYEVGKNPEVLPDLPLSFSLSTPGSITTRVLDVQKKAYVRVADDSVPKRKIAFWAVEIVNDQIKIHGYLGDGIAYSWKNGAITFCTPEFYKKNGRHC